MASKMSMSRCALALGLAALGDVVERADGADELRRRPRCSGPLCTAHPADVAVGAHDAELDGDGPGRPSASGPRSSPTTAASSGWTIFAQP